MSQEPELRRSLGKGGRHLIIRSLLFGAAVALSMAGSTSAAEHPGSGSPCGDCHDVGAGQGAPEVSPETPGFFAKLLGEKDLRGHPDLSCAGTRLPGGELTGCHRPEEGYRGLLAVDLAVAPSDELCGICHPQQRVPGNHHPSYLADKDRNGTLDTPVRAHESQEIYTTYAASGFPEPVASHPDALAYRVSADGSRQRLVALPTETAQVTIGEEVRVEENLVTCTSCHNPHYGYLVEVGSADELARDAVVRESGDALLRLRDYDNTLCDACH